jgi:hypothetical protein
MTFKKWRDDWLGEVGAGLCSANGPITFVAGTVGNKGGRSVFTEQIRSKQIYQRIGSLNLKTVRYSSTLSTLMTVLVINDVTRSPSGHWQIDTGALKVTSASAVYIRVCPQKPR